MSQVLWGALLEIANPEIAAHSQRFFKIGGHHEFPLYLRKIVNKDFNFCHLKPVNAGLFEFIVDNFPKNHLLRLFQAKQLR